jgi:sulfide:quinone oxidoreductase
MDIRNVTDEFAVGPQIAVSDTAKLATQGFSAIICNRPDAEEEGQPTASEIRAAAQAAGLAFHHIPVSGGEYPEAAVAAFSAVRRGTDGRVFAYCKSGTRAVTLETLANPDCAGVEERLARAAEAGYDLSGLSDKLG